MKEEPIDLIKLFGVIRRQLRLVSVIFAGLMLLTAGVLFNATPLYQATALVFVDPSRKDILAPQTSLAPSGTEQSRIESEVYLLKSERVLLTAVERAGLANDPEFGSHVRLLDRAMRFAGFEPRGPQARLDLAIARLSDALEVGRQGTTYLAEVTVMSMAPQKAAALANDIAYAYLDLQVEAKTEAVLAARDALQPQLDLARAQSVEAARQLREQTARRARPVVADTAEAVLSQAEVFELQKSAQLAQEHYGVLLSKMRELEAQAVLQIADSRVVTQARAPLYPSSPNHALVVILAGVFALVTGTGAAFAKEYWVGGVVSLSQLHNITPAPALGAISHAVPEPAQLSPADLVISAPLSTYSENLRRIRAGIDQSSEQDKQVIMVTSPLSGEGKSVLALSLARTYAEAGKEVLLIDANLRAPSLHNYIGYKPDRGFLEYLRAPMASNTQDRKFYIADPRSSAGIMLGRGEADVPTDKLLQSEAFSKLIASAKTAVDVLVIDTSAILPVVDARYVAQHADVILMAVQYSKTSQADIRDTYAQLEAAKGRQTKIFTTLNDSPTGA